MANDTTTPHAPRTGRFGRLSLTTAAMLAWTSLAGCVVLKDVGESADTSDDDSSAGSSASADTSSDTGSASSSTDPTAEGSSTTSGAEESTTGDDAQALCEGSAGVWHEDSCGDYTCGAPPACAAVIPGCDCGPNANFEQGTGCVTDVACEADAQEQLCTGSGGVWHPTTCDHYVCGVPNDCAAVIPGCDCGGQANFLAGSGCEPDPSCGGLAIGEVCDPTTGGCVAGASCCYPCGIQGCDYVCEMDDPGNPGQCPPPPP